MKMSKFPIETSDLADFSLEQNLTPKLMEYVAENAEHSLRCGPCACGEQKRAEKVTIDSMRMWRERFRLPVDSLITGWEEDPNRSFICTVAQTTCQICQHKQRSACRVSISKELEKHIHKGESK